MRLRKPSRDGLKGIAHIVYHIAVIVGSAGIAVSLPVFAGFLARNLLVLWAWVENDKLFLLATEMGLAIALILLANYVRRRSRDKRITKMARMAGMVHAFASRGRLAERRIRRLKAEHGVARDVMIIGSTGARTLLDPSGELHHVLKTCRRARILLLNPWREGASVRAKSILAPEVTLESFREQIRKSIEVLRELRMAQRDIRLKLYEDTPFLKLAILGDHAWVKHYHAGVDVRQMPEYVFAHDQSPGGLYTVLYQYFLARWETPEIPEYDFETDELVHRDRAGREVKRVQFGEAS